MEGLFSDLPFNDDIESWDKVVVTDKSEGVEHVEQADHVEDDRPAWPLILSESILQESESESILQESESESILQESELTASCKRDLGF